MGNSFSAKDYKDSIAKFQAEFLSPEDSQTLSAFLIQSEDFYNVFTTVMLEDFRRIKQDKIDNLAYLLSYVRRDIFANVSLRSSRPCTTSRSTTRSSQKRLIPRPSRGA